MLNTEFKSFQDSVSTNIRDSVSFAIRSLRGYEITSVAYFMDDVALFDPSVIHRLLLP